MLRGPADADQFRVKVGRYGDRWYHDPLPGCDIAPACTDEWPATSIVKNAWPKFLTNWAAGEAAACAVDQRHIWEQMARPAAITYIGKAHDRSRDGAASRGSAVHRIIEAFSEGREPGQLDLVEAGDWVPACKQLVTDLQPEWVLAEAVTINRELGVGGTLDAVLRIDGKTYLVDYKSRGLDKDGKGKHGAYADEAAQLGSYASGYVIVDEGGRAVRRNLPHLDGGLVITIAPDGYRLYPVDLGQARDLFASLRHFWESMQTNPVGKPVHLKPAAGATAAAQHSSVPATDLFADDPAASSNATGPSAEVLRADLTKRVKVISGYDNGVAVLGAELAKRGLGKLSATPDDALESWLLAVKDAESDLRVPFTDAQMIYLPAGDPQITAVIARCKQLPADLLAAVEANTVGAGRCPNLASGKATQADLALVVEQVELAEAEHERRKIYVAALVAPFTESEAVMLRIEAAPRSEWASLTESDVERLELLVNAIDALVVAFTFDDDIPRLSSTDQAEALLVEAHGSKSAVLTVARTKAGEHGRAAPRSVAAVVADPVLAAITFLPTNQTTQQEKAS